MSALSLRWQCSDASERQMQWYNYRLTKKQTDKYDIIPYEMQFERALKSRHKLA